VHHHGHHITSEAEPRDPDVFTEATSADVIIGLHYSLLEDEGYSVGEAGDGVSGRDALASSSVPLVVLLDQTLPVLDGCDLLALVQPDQALHRHAFIFITAHNAHDVKDDRDDLPDRIGVAVIFKPFDVDDVLAAVAEADSRLDGAQ
jgi:CheY-like chemotaxis protein